MPKAKKSKPKLLLKQVTRSPEDLEEFIREADEVNNLTNTKGWSILARDLTEYRNSLISKLAYLNPKRPEHYEARILFIAVDKIFSMVSDYRENRDRAIELLQKLENPDLAIAMDVDTE